MLIPSSAYHSHMGGSRACWTVCSPYLLLIFGVSPIPADPYRGQYDQEYLDYLRELLTEMNEEGVAAYIVCHYQLRMLL